MELIGKTLIRGAGGTPCRKHKFSTKKDLLTLVDFCLSFKKSKIIDNSVPDVTVVDSNKRFLGYTRRGKARKLIGLGKAKWLQKEPPVIKYLAKPPEKITYRRKEVMEKRIVNWTDFFNSPRDIYAQNVSNCQVSVEFETSPGNRTGFLFPQTRDPVNLTQHIPWEAIKNSIDFRKMLNRRPPAVLLMNEEEYTAYFAQKAARMSEAGRPISTEDAMDQSSEKLQRIHNKQDYTTDETPEPLHKVTQDDAHFGGKKRVEANEQLSEDEIIHPRVLHLCNQVHVDIPDKEKMRAHVMMEELDNIGPDLKMDDYEYIRSHSYWKTVKNWARSQISAAVNKDNAEGADDTFATT